MDTIGSIADAHPRAIATVGGRIVSIEVQPRDATPTLIARISDGTGVVDAVFVGRRTIPGITAGAHVVVTGRISAADAAPRMFNPRFELRP